MLISLPIAAFLGQGDPYPLLSSLLPWLLSLLPPPLAQKSGFSLKVNNLPIQCINFTLIPADVIDRLFGFISVFTLLEVLFLFPKQIETPNKHLTGAAPEESQETQWRLFQWKQTGSGIRQMGSEHTEGKETKWRETFQASRIQHQHQNKTLKSNNVERLKRVNQRKEDDIISYKVQNYGVLKMKFLFEKMTKLLYFWAAIRALVARFFESGPWLLMYWR